jgi:hypothetical protein
MRDYIVLALGVGLTVTLVVYAYVVQPPRRQVCPPSPCSCSEPNR